MPLLREMKVKPVLKDFQKRKRSSAVAGRLQELLFQVFVNDGKRNQFHRWVF
jgi:hypothetical protein